MGQKEVHALDNVSLSIPKGQFVALTGRSGSGKSTLLHMIAAMERPSSGSILVDGIAIEQMSTKDEARFRRNVIGMIFQQFNLIPNMTARENVELPLTLAGLPSKERQEKATMCLSMVSIDHRADHRPTELSGGEQQRVAIARSLVQNPSILLADEPTGNVDSETAEQIVGVLRSVSEDQGKTVVIVTHHLPEVENSVHRVLTLKDGKLVGDES